MNKNQFAYYWESHFGNCPPIGQMLRKKFYDRFLRIHTMPDSKAYADGEADFQSLLRVNNELLEEVIGTGSNYSLVTTSYGSVESPFDEYPELKEMVPDFEYFLSYEDEEPICECHFFFSNRVWARASQNNLLRLVADEIVTNVLLVDYVKEFLYYPYHGGADIIAPDIEAKYILQAKLQSRFFLDLSPRLRY